MTIEIPDGLSYRDAVDAAKTEIVRAAIETHGSNNKAYRALSMTREGLYKVLRRARERARG